jgi:hypothetical protein
MGIKAANAAMWHSKEATLIGLTLITSAIHFADNAFRLDLYPGPAWLTHDVVLAAWVFLLLSACLVYWINTRTALVAYGVLGLGLVGWPTMSSLRQAACRRDVRSQLVRRLPHQCS